MEEELKRLLRENKVIPFVGAGVSMEIKDKNGNQLFPSWTELLKKFAYNLEKSGHSAEANLINAYFGLSKFDYLEVADKIKKFYPSKQSFNDLLKEIFDKHSSEIDLESLALPKSIWELGQDLIITTNYDKVLHWASNSPSDTAYWDIQSISEQGKALRDGVLKPTVWHLHGHIEHIDNLVLTTESYNKLYDNNANSEFKAAYTALLTFLASKSFLFIGYSLDDDFFVNELEKICAIFEGNSSEHYVLLRNGTSLPKKLKGKITPIFFDDYGQPLIDKIKSLIPTTSESIERLSSITSVPTKNNADYLTSLPPRNENFLGRVDELKKLEDTLTNEGMVYIVNGIGGIGKSELSYEYLHRNKERYDNIAFLEFSDEKTSIEELFRIKFKERFALTENDNLESIITKLQRLKTKNLLLLDNLYNREDFEKIKALNSNFHLLITTRRGDLESKYSLNLEVLSDEDARALFVSYYSTDENIDDILKYLDNHSLFIYLTAKTLASGYLTLEELRENIKSGQIGKIEAHDEKSFNIHLEQRFKRQFEEEQNPDLKLLLQQLSTFPSIEIEEEKLLLSLTDVNTKRNLAKLVQRGWLTKKENSYKLHQIVKTFIWDNYPLSYTKATPILDAIASYIHPDDAIIIPNYELIFIPIIDSLLSLYSSNKDNHIAGVLDSLTFLYFSTGNYSKSLEIQMQSEILRKQVFGENSVEVAKNYNLEGVLYKGLGELKNAFFLFEKALEIQEKTLGERHFDTLQTYNNLAVLHQNMKDHQKALTLHKKVLKIREDFLGIITPYVASSYDNLGTLYHSMNEHKIAIPLLEKALKIREELLEKTHPHIANNYNNLASVYKSLKEYKKALPLYEKALKIREDTFGEKHPDTAQSYNSLAALYHDIGENKKAHIFYEKALNTQQELLGEKHPDTALTYFNLSYLYEQHKQCTQALITAKKAVEILESLDYTHPDLYKYKNHLNDIEQKIKKEQKLPYNKKGRYCKD
ncbi:MAG: tetratricopeptide repeat protein [Sulfuricurvum sp.]|uniref:tetratricopeptide repeat protein n=1 Tax=Sulfuricurvum sp. TaxID=2025608 RepID=UPI0027324ED3|nr:tetratricopeptide repeat protein [Sulfuricurvum sp.]MDP2851152.1 tetratricopeptide repeat protein [Sulfuricurvum sp.]